MAKGFDSIREFAESKNYSIGIPYGIGCGLGGANWVFVTEIIRDVFAYSSVVDIKICRNKKEDGSKSTYIENGVKLVYKQKSFIPDKNNTD